MILRTAGRIAPRAAGCVFQQAIRPSTGPLSLAAQAAATYGLAFVSTRIVYVTDCVDIAANELRAALLSATDGQDVVIEPMVPARPAFSAVNGNFAMWLMAQDYPPGTVLLSTLSSARRRPLPLLGRTAKKDLVFIGRNTGVFDWLTRDLGCVELYSLARHYGEGEQFVNFAGRSITAPLAARAASGEPLDRIGDPVGADVLHRLDLPDHTVVHADNFGNLKFTGEPERPAEGARYQVSPASPAASGRLTVEATYTQRMMGLPTGAFAVYPGSSYGLYELGCVRGDAAGALGLDVGDRLRLTRAG